MKKRCRCNHIRRCAPPSPRKRGRLFLFPPDGVDVRTPTRSRQVAATAERRMRRRRENYLSCPDRRMAWTGGALHEADKLPHRPRGTDAGQPSRGEKKHGRHGGHANNLESGRQVDCLSSTGKRRSRRRPCGHIHEADKLRARALPEKAAAEKFTSVARAADRRERAVPSLRGLFFCAEKWKNETAHGRWWRANRRESAGG